MIMTALTATFYIMVGTFDSLVTFIGMVLNRKPNCLSLNLFRYIGIHFLLPSRCRHLRPPPPREIARSISQDMDLQSHYILPLQWLHCRPRNYNGPTSRASTFCAYDSRLGHLLAKVALNSQNERQLIQRSADS